MGNEGRAYSPNGRHTVFIPVMGTGFTVDTPLKVARYGITSVISLVDDTLLEQMRKYHCDRTGEPYEEIGAGEDDARARRITAYLDLVGRLVAKQVEDLRASPFEAGSEITRYFDLIPESPLKDRYYAMQRTADPAAKMRLQEKLRHEVVPGGIDVNIMTKVDRVNFRHGRPLPPEFSDAKAALRGYALSRVASSIEFSAGLNTQLYSYASQFEDFFPDENGEIRKRIVLKVSDLRSAETQGKFLAKRGLWVSEYRIESGLNCGGHAFPSRGLLLGPILEEFRRKRLELAEQAYEILKRSSVPHRLPDPGSLRVSVAGGIGTTEEHRFLLTHYRVDAGGWGTPFLLVPEVTNVDEATLEKLAAATSEDVYLSPASPLGIPFWNLRSSASEEARRRLIEEGRPGSVCLKGHAKVNQSVSTGRPACLAARSLISEKLQGLRDERLTEAQKAWTREDILAKSCICHDLAGGATLKYGIDPTATPAVCCGPGIVNFSKVASLEEMVGHIYGRLSLLTNPERPHMFLRELSLNIEYLKDELRKFSIGVLKNAPAYFEEFRENLTSGIEYYHRLAEQFVEDKRRKFLQELQAQKDALEAVFAEFPLQAAEQSA